MILSSDSHEGPAEILAESRLCHVAAGNKIGQRTSNVAEKKYHGRLLAHLPVCHPWPHVDLSLPPRRRPTRRPAARARTHMYYTLCKLLCGDRLSARIARRHRLTQQVSVGVRLYMWSVCCTALAAVSTRRHDRCCRAPNIGQSECSQCHVFRGAAALCPVTNRETVWCVASAAGGPASIAERSLQVCMSFGS